MYSQPIVPSSAPGTAKPDRKTNAPSYAASSVPNEFQRHPVGGTRSMSFSSINATQPPSYSLAERDRRWQLARELMDAEKVDGLLVYGDREGTGPAPFAPDTYFTNERPG